jgi:hypothetical protein
MKHKQKHQGKPDLKKIRKSLCKASEKVIQIKNKNGYGGNCALKRLCG